MFTRPWKISMPFYRHKDMDRLLEYQCQAEAEKPTAPSRESRAPGIPSMIVPDDMTTRSS